MNDKPESIYQPPSEVEPAKRKPGRPPKSASAVAAKSAVEVVPGITADAALAPNAAPQEGETLEQAIERIRKVRQPFGGAMQQKLALPKRTGYHRHWFNDVAGRIDEASASGWAHIINPRDGKPFRRVVGSGRDSKAIEAYAMELPEVFWQEEMDARNKLAMAKLDSIKKNPFASKPGQAQESDKGKFYDPTEGTGKGPLQISTPAKA